MLKFPLFLVSFWSYNLVWATDNYFVITRSPKLLDSWAEAELKFAEALQPLPLQLRKITPEQLGRITSYLADFSNCTKNLRGFGRNPQENINAVTYNPIATFRMIRRILQELTFLKETKIDPDAFPQENLYDLFNVFPEDGWLREDDFKEAISAILRISHVYSLKAEDLAKGVILGMDTGVHLQAIHCYEIGSQAIHQKSHVLSIEWLEMSLAKANDGTIGKDTIEKAYQKAIIEHDNTRSNLDPLDDPSYIYEQLLTPIQNHVNFKSLRQAKKQLLINEFGGDSPDLDLTTFVNYWLLCSGADLQSPANKSKLFCWYERKIHPYLYIGPIKMELLGTKPDIVQMYDVIGDGKIQRLTEVARQNLSLSRVVDPSGDALSPVRTSVQSWIVENFHEEFRVLPKIIEILTGLNVVEGTSSEMLQIAAYTFSGHYEIHLDALLTPDYEGEKELGNRMATFMYYLQQPELGGQTAFPQSRVATQPIKGSAVFWYDLLDDGSVDGTTFHGACPVVYGRKWGNKWIRYLDQQKNRKCGLKPNEWFSIHSATRGKI